MATNKNNNKSLFLYTGLIFVVAVLLILLSFFGQMNLQKNQPKTEETEEVTQTTNTGITERAAVLSEENKNLLEENTQLKKENEELLEKIVQNDILLAANGYYTLGANDKALERLLAVDYENLTTDQQMIYDAIKEGLDAAE